MPVKPAWPKIPVTGSLERTSFVEALVLGCFAAAAEYDLGLAAQRIRFRESLESLTRLAGRVGPHAAFPHDCLSALKITLKFYARTADQANSNGNRSGTRRRKLQPVQGGAAFLLPIYLKLQEDT